MYILSHPTNSLAVKHFDLKHYSLFAMEPLSVSLSLFYPRGYGTTAKRPYSLLDIYKYCFSNRMINSRILDCWVAPLQALSDLL